MHVQAMEHHRTHNTTLTYVSGKSPSTTLFDLNELRTDERQFSNTLVVVMLCSKRWLDHLSCLTKSLKIIQFDSIFDPFMINLFSPIT